MKNKLSLGIFGSLGFFALFFLTPATYAIGIQPVRQELEVKPGESIELKVKVTNETNDDYYAEPNVEAFYQTDEKGFPIFADEETKKIEDVASWITFPEKSVLVPANKSTPITFKVTVPSNAEPGGKYLTIFYQRVKEASAPFKVNTSAGSLLLLNVAGNIIKTGELTGFSSSQDPSNDEPFHFDVSYQNTGNTHLKPQGKIEITNLETGEKMKEISSYVNPETGATIVSDFLPVNLEKSNALPGSVRIYKPEWTQKIQLGRFKASLSLESTPDTPPIEKSLEFSLNEKLAVESFELKKGEGEKSSYFELKVKNSGDQNQKLHGAVVVENLFGQQMKKIEVPETWKIIKPGEAQTYELKWLEKDIPEGRYNANLQITYGYTKQKLEGKTSFGSLDTTKIILAVALGVMIIITLTTLIKKNRKKK